MTPLGKALLALITLACITQSALLWQLRMDVRALGDGSQATASELQVLAAEVTRFRIEQAAEGKGAHALLEKLQALAPELATSLRTKPHYTWADQEMQATKRAIASIGADAWPLMRARFDQLDPKKDYDEAKHVLDALIAADRTRGVELTADVLRGRVKPNPRLRWWAADLLLANDLPLAQLVLRQILTTESSRGMDPNRAAATGGVLDPAAIATQGFSNFVSRYVRSNDPEMNDVLLQLLVRQDSDLVTVQDCIEILGERKDPRAVAHIERLYQNPPGAQLNPLFLNKCIDALVAIQGDGARGFLEEQLAKTQNELVSRHLQRALSEINGGSSEAGTGR
jgi:hypothetical protein